MNGRHFYDFGPFRLDPAERVLLRNNHPVAVPPKDLETLLLLVERRGHIVEKNELLERVWAGVFVEEGNLAKRVSNLRTLLSNGTDGQGFIETIPKRGYRFVAEVREVMTEPAARKEELTAASKAPSKRRSPRSYLPATLVAVVVLTTVTTTAVLAWRHRAGTAARSPGRVILAVLPVQNLSGNPERDYVSDGLTEEIISQLGNLNPKQLAVIARTSSMTYQHTKKTVHQIGGELNVDCVLEASLRESAGTYRISAQLVRTSDQTQFWAHDYEGATDNVLMLQKQIAQAVSQQIGETFTMGVAPSIRMRSQNPEAYDAYLKGRFFWNKRTPEGVKTAAGLFERAIELDARYAAAYSGLADCFDLEVWFEQMTPKDGFPRASQAAMKAVELDEELAEGHASLASIKGDYEWNWRASEAEYHRALELNPSYATAHHWYAELLAAMGRLPEATAEIQKARETDPLSPVINTTLGEMYCRAGDCEKAIAQYQRVLQMYPGFPQAQYLMAEAFARTGKYDQAAEEIENAKKLPELGTVWAQATLGYAAAMSGRRTEALQQAARLKRNLKAERAEFLLATIYSALGDKDAAFFWLDEAVQRRDYSMTMVQADYRLDNLRTDPRYKALLRRMNF